MQNDRFSKVLKFECLLNGTIKQSSHVLDHTKSYLRINLGDPYNSTSSLPRSKPFLCLNMIVKNESKIIERLLNSVCSVIDSFCICDTGSTDDTIEKIRRYFKQKNLPGEVCC